MKKNIKPYVVFIIISLFVGGLSAFFTRNNMDIYNKINTPPLSPPSIPFPIVWTILYILMGVSAALIYNDRFAAKHEIKSALYTFGASLIVNFFWSIIFFNLNAFLFAFIWLLLLLYLIVVTIIKYYKIRPLAAYLQIPYLLWVTFAGYLTLSIWYLNR